MLPTRLTHNLLASYPHHDFHSLDSKVPCRQWKFERCSIPNLMYDLRKWPNSKSLIFLIYTLEIRAPVIHRTAEGVKCCSLCVWNTKQCLVLCIQKGVTFTMKMCGSWYFSIYIIGKTQKPFFQMKLTSQNFKSYFKHVGLLKTDPQTNVWPSYLLH